MISRNTVKSKASRVHPSQAAHQAYHWSLLGSFHHGILFTVSTAAMVITPCSSPASPSVAASVKQLCGNVMANFQLHDAVIGGAHPPRDLRIADGISRQRCAPISVEVSWGRPAGFLYLGAAARRSNSSKPQPAKDWPMLALSGVTVQEIGRSVAAVEKALC